MLFFEFFLQKKNVIINKFMMSHKCFGKVDRFCVSSSSECFFLSFWLFVLFCIEVFVFLGIYVLF